MLEELKLKMTVKKTESKLFLIDANLRLTSKASKIGLSCNAWWEGLNSRGGDHGT